MQQYFLDVVAAGKKVPQLDVHSFHIKEGIGQPYRIEVTVTCPDPDLPLLRLLDQPATFRIPLHEDDIVWPKPDAMLKAAPPITDRRWHGVLREARRVSSSRDETQYFFVIEPRLARLRDSKTTRLLQNESVPQAVENVLRAAGFQGGDFQFDLRRQPAVRDHLTLWSETPYDFIHRLLESEGIWFVLEQKENTDCIRFFDDNSHYQRLKGRVDVILQRSDAGLLSHHRETVRSLAIHTRPALTGVETLDYNYRSTAGAPLYSTKKTTSTAPGEVGEHYIYGPNYKTPDEGADLARLHYEISHAQQVQAHGSGNVLAFAPAQVFKTDQTFSEAEFGWVIVSIEHSGARDKAYSNSFVAIPADTQYRMPLDTPKPRISGTIPARITSPSKYEYAFLDQQGRVRITYDFDQDKGSWPPGGSSRPVRLASIYSGSDYGITFPPIDGQEIQVGYVGGDPDRPYVAHTMHDQMNPAHLTLDTFTKNIIRTAAGNEIRLEDKRSNEHVRIFSPYGQSWLDLGHLVDSKYKGNDTGRGHGFELKTSEWGSIRAGKGLYLSAHERTNASTQQLDIAEARSQLDQALGEMKSLSMLAEHAKALAADVDQQQQMLQQKLDKLQAAVLIASAPQGVAIASGEHLQLAASKNLIVTAGNNADLGVMKRLTVAAGEAISLFAHKLGIKLFAASGKVEIQAQGDNLELIATKDILQTAGKRIVIGAKDELMLVGNGGSYIKLNGGNVEVGGPGKLLIKTAGISKQGASSQSVAMPDFGKDQFDEKFILRHTSTGKPLANKPYKIKLADGQIVQGVTDAKGQTSLSSQQGLSGMQFKLGATDPKAGT